MIDGEPEYDKFIPTDEGGADSYPYDFHNVSWEKDFLVTAIQSPQQGDAPLVGMSNNGPRSDDGTYRYYYMHYTDENGKYQSIRVREAITPGGYNSLGFNALESSASGVVGLTGPEIQGDLEILNDAATFGISINDLRNVNALQRWLEKNAARGFRYKDQMLSHFGVDLSLEMCDMPEYLGGFNQKIDVNTINQTTPTETDPLGQFGGLGYCVGGSENKIHYFCEEHGFIIGVMYIVPTPTYSQLLPKHFTKYSPLDYYTPEFAHIGPQPIRYSEVCPLQAVNENVSLNDVFGYQRAWYDYMRSVDEVHGLFRTDLRKFIAGRLFGSTPQLSKSFLYVDDSQIEDIVATQNEISDKIIGQVVFNLTVEEPIPMLNTPGLL